MNGNLQTALAVLICVALAACSQAADSLNSSLGYGAKVASEPLVGKADSASNEPQPWEQPVPRAICGLGSRPESGLQGQVPLLDRQSGRSLEGYNCNLTLIGHVGDSALWSHAWYKDCAYYSTPGTTGTTVVDASDSANPLVTERLTTLAMTTPHESLKVNQKRGLLAAVESAGPGFSIYDLTQDCRHPKLLADVTLSQHGHEGNFAPDGLTYYAGNANAGADGASYYPIDISNPVNPKVLTNWLPPDVGVVLGGSPNHGVHGLSVSQDGNRGYFAWPALQGSVASNGVPANGFLVLDLSEVQSRHADPQIKVISSASWADGGESQHTIPVKIRGKPYLIHVDELGSGGLAGDAAWGWSCAHGLPPFGFARIFDISDETHPKLVSKLMLDTHDPTNCAEVIKDPTGETIFAYDSHYCSVDDQENTTVVGCGYFNSGLRIFDIRDPYHPKELAYFVPPVLTSDHAAYSTSQVRFVKERGEVWTTDQRYGFYIVKFNDGVWPFKQTDVPAPVTPLAANSAAVAEAGSFGGSFGLWNVVWMLLAVCRRRAKPGWPRQSGLRWHSYADQI